MPPDAGADPFLVQQLHGGKKDVLKDSEITLAQGVDGVEGCQRVIAHVAEELANVSPVLLLHGGVVVLLVGATSRELDAMLPGVLQELVVDELLAVVRVDPPESEREVQPDVLQDCADRRQGLAEDRAGLDPGGVDVRDVQRMEELAVRPVAAMGHQVDLCKPRGLNPPSVCPERDVMLEESPPLRPAIEPLLQSPAIGLEAPIHLPGLIWRSCSSIPADTSPRTLAQGSQSGSRALRRTEQG
jgi:hypothetical protein